MKTSKGYTKADEAAEHGKYVVGYCEGIAADPFFVPFTNRKAADKFADNHGRQDPFGSPRGAWIVSDNEEELI